MHRTLAIFSSLVAVACAIGAMGCSSSPSAAPPSPGCATADVSFKTDVVPVFEKSCTLTSVCHGQMNNAAEENLYLGENAGGTVASTMFAQIVGIPAKEIPAMNLVTPADLDHSFLWHKVNDGATGLAALGSQCMTAVKQCSDCTPATPCGNTMPYSSGALDPTFACTIKNWILNGAMNN